MKNMKNLVFAIFIFSLLFFPATSAHAEEQTVQNPLQSFFSSIINYLSGLEQSAQVVSSNPKSITLLSAKQNLNTTQSLLETNETLTKLDSKQISGTCGATLLPTGVKGQTIKCDGQRWVANSFLRNLESNTNDVIHIGDNWLPPIPVMLNVTATEVFDGPDGPETATAIYGYSKSPFIAGAGIKGVSEFGKGIMGSSQLGTGVFGISSSGDGVVSVGGFRQYLSRDSSFEGNVGIGTENPQKRLHVAQSGESAILLTNDSSGHLATDGLFVGMNNNQPNSTIWNFENGYLRFGTNNTERMRITSTGGGNVGIGTTNPNTLLHLFRPNGYTIVSIEAGGNKESSLVHFKNREGTWEVGNDGTRDASFVITDGINQIPNFLMTKSGNVGISTADPSAKLQVNGGIRILPEESRPSCNASQRGMFWFTQGATGVKDSAQVCAKDASDNYGWRTIY